MSAQNYFRDFVYRDSGMILWLLVAELASNHGSLADVVTYRKTAFSSSCQMYFPLKNPGTAMAQKHAVFESVAYANGLGFKLGAWRFSPRGSYT